jgi:hypothetical protein
MIACTTCATCTLTRDQCAALAQIALDRFRAEIERQKTDRLLTASS